MCIYAVPLCKCVLCQLRNGGRAWVGLALLLVPIHHLPQWFLSPPLPPVFYFNLSSLPSCWWCLSNPMEDHLSFPLTQPHSSLPQSSPHSAPISNESLNDLLWLIESQKNYGFWEVKTHGFTGRATTLSLSVLDSAGCKLEECTPQIQMNTTSCPQPMHSQPPPLSSLAGINLNTPQVAYNVDSLGSIGQPDAYTQVSMGSMSH